MVTGHPILPREAVESGLPVLRLAPNTTKSSKMHEMTYVGPLYQVLNLEANVRASMSARWAPTVIEHNLRSRDIRQEEVYVADETGLQGRSNTPSSWRGLQGRKRGHSV